MPTAQCLHDQCSDTQLFCVELNSSTSQIFEMFLSPDWFKSLKEKAHGKKKLSQYDKDTQSIRKNQTNSTSRPYQQDIQCYIY